MGLMCRLAPARMGLMVVIVGRGVKQQLLPCQRTGITGCCMLCYALDWA